ncbi:MAG: hypothetical protein RBJ76_16450 [Stenomitos frigidus ULC029]
MVDWICGDRASASRLTRFIVGGEWAMACRAGWLGRSIGIALMLLTLQEGGGRSSTAAKAAGMSSRHTAPS